MNNFVYKTIWFGLKKRKFGPSCNWDQIKPVIFTVVFNVFFNNTNYVFLGFKNKRIFKTGLLK